MTKVSFTTGNFDLEISGDLKPDVQEQINKNGLAWIVQRDVASNVFKDLGGVGEKKTLPKGFERSSIEFSPESAELMHDSAVAHLGKYLENPEVEVSQHVPSEGAGEPGKMATAMWEQVKNNEALRSNLGVAAGADDEVGIAACSTFLAGLRKTPKAKA